MSARQPATRRCCTTDLDRRTSCATCATTRARSTCSRCSCRRGTSRATSTNSTRTPHTSSRTAPRWPITMCSRLHGSLYFWYCNVLAGTSTRRRLCSAACTSLISTTAPRSTFRSRSSRTSRVVGHRKARRRSLSHVLGAAHALLRQEDHPADGGRLRRGAHHQVEQGRQDVQRVGRLRGHVHLRHHRQVRMQPSVRLEARSWLTKLQSLVPSPASITVRTQNCSTRARRRSRCSSSSTTRPRSSIYPSTCRYSSSVGSIDCVIMSLGVIALFFVLLLALSHVDIMLHCQGEIYGFIKLRILIRRRDRGSNR